MTNTYRLEQKFEDKSLKDAKLLYALDKYDTHGVLHLYSEAVEDLSVLGKELLKKYDLKGIYLKRRFDTELNHTELIAGKKAPKEFAVIENDMKFLIRMEDHIDVGLFLDHRLSREIIMSHAKGKDVLNLFAYTGSFSVYAAKGGAKNTTTVDLSATYCKWAKENFIANEMEANLEGEKGSVNSIWKMDSFDFIDLAMQTKTRFDIIVCDPPSFSRNKSEVFNLQKDHAELLKNLQEKLLKRNGILFFSTNLQSFKMDEYLRPGADKLTKQTIPEEFKPFKPHQSYVFYN